MKTTFNSKGGLTVLSLLSVTAFICLSSAAMIITNADFSGAWTLNETKSELGQFGGRMAARKMKIAADATSISIERGVTNMNGEATTMTDKLTFDGKETESAGFMNSKKKSTAKWSDEGQTLNVTSLTVLDRDGQKMEIKGTEVWKLADGGKTLQVTTTSSSSFGENTSKLVYEKAQ